MRKNKLHWHHSNDYIQVVEYGNCFVNLPEAKEGHEHE